MSLFIVGAGGHAKVVLATALEAGFKVVGFLDEDSSKWGSELLGVPILGPLSLLRKSEGYRAVLAIGDNEARRRIDQEIKGVRWVTLVHPGAYVHPSVALGEGTVVFAGALVQPMARVGRHVIINTGVIVEHDCEIGDYSHLAPGVRLAGGVKVGTRCLLGVGAVAVPLAKIGDGSIVGAGSVVVKDIPPRSLAYGVPARVRGRLD